MFHVNDALRIFLMPDPNQRDKLDPDHRIKVIN
jgi:hypothetical protein